MPHVRPLLCAPCPASFSKTSRGRATCFAGFSRYGRQQTEGPNERGSAQNRTPLRLKISNKGFVQRLGEKGGGKDAPGAGTDGDSAFAAMRAACGACRFLSRACAVLLLFPGFTRAISSVGGASRQRRSAPGHSRGIGLSALKAGNRRLGKAGKADKLSLGQARPQARRKAASGNAQLLSGPELGLDLPDLWCSVRPWTKRKFCSSPWAICRAT